jgi:hypothetical protein
MLRRRVAPGRPKGPRLIDIETGLRVLAVAQVEFRRLQGENQ